MRPNTFEIVGSSGQQFIYATASGNSTADDNSTCQNCSGNMGFFILRPKNKFFQLVAESDHFLEEGTNGEAPNKDFLKVVQISQNGNYAWIAKINSFNRGTFYENAAVYAANTNKISAIGLIPLYYNDHESSCFDIEKKSAEACSDFRTEMSFDLTKLGSFAPIMLQVSGTSKGKTLNTTYSATFDTQKQNYVLPDDFPKN